MRPRQTDVSAFERIHFDKKPVGIKYLFFKPEGVDPLPMDRHLSLCEMIVEAQEADAPFYFCREHTETCVGKILLGMEDMEPFAEAGEIGPRLGMMEESRVNHQLYHHVPRMEKGVVNYLVLSPIDKLTFEPDVVIVTATLKQAEILMRAMSYSTGRPYVSKSTMVMGCSWIFIYPFETGEVNYILPEMVHGMTGRELFAPNSVLIGIPYQWLQTVSQNLKTVKLEIHETKEAYLSEFGEILVDLVEKSNNP